MNLLQEIIKGCNKGTTDQVDFSNRWNDDGMSGYLSEEILFSIESDTSYVVAKIEGTRKFVGEYSPDPTEQFDPITNVEIEIERVEWGMCEVVLSSRQENELISHINGVLIM